MKRYAIPLIALAAIPHAVPVAAQDVVVMRRHIAAPNPKSPAAPAYPEMLKGGGFDASNSAWVSSPWDSWITTEDGRKVRSMQSRGVYGQASTYQVVGGIEPGAKYRYTIEWRRTGTLCPDTVTIRMRNGSSGSLVEKQVSCPGTNWTTTTLEITATATVLVVYMYNGYSGDGYTNIQLDTASLKRIG